MKNQETCTDTLSIITKQELEQVAGGQGSLSPTSINKVQSSAFLSLRVDPRLTNMIAANCDCCRWEPAIV